MIYIVSGSQRTGTSLLMNIFKSLGFEIIGEEFPLPELSDFNPDGFYDSGNIIIDENLRLEDLNGKVIKIFFYQFEQNKLYFDILKNNEYKIIITIRNPLYSISSHYKLQNTKKEKGLSSGMSLTKCIKNYTESYYFLSAVFMKSNINYLIVHYNDYEKNVDSLAKRLCQFIYDDIISEKEFIIKNSYKPELNRSSKSPDLDSIKEKIITNSEFEKSLEIYSKMLKLMEN